MKTFFPYSTLYFFIISFSYFLSPSAIVQAEIVEISEIAQLRSYIEEGTLFLFDVDDNLIDLPCLHLGGPAWRDWATLHVDDSNVDFDLVDAVSLHIAKKLTYKPVEDATTALIKELQENNATVLGYTARGRNLWSLMPVKGVDQFTHTQLLQAGFDFTRTKIPEELLPILDPTYFYKGVIYSARIKKGDLLKKLFLEHSCFPKRIIFCG